MRTADIGLAIDWEGGKFGCEIEGLPLILDEACEALTQQGLQLLSKSHLGPALGAVDQSDGLAAREKRLKRECRGRPNAGACLGHTR